MRIDLHVHSKEGSDGRLGVEEIFAEANRRGVGFISITDHDSVGAQGAAALLAARHGMRYVTGAELNVTFTHPSCRSGKPVSLDFLAYGINVRDRALIDKLVELAAHRERRARQILDNLNAELVREGIAELTDDDMAAIQATVDGSIGRPHIANYLVSKGIVSSRQEAFDRYLVRCDVPKLPLSLADAAGLVHGAGGQLVLAHPNDPNGTSLAAVSPSLEEQQALIRDAMLKWIDGVECWHPRHDPETSRSYMEFADRLGLMVTGGSDCHQQPVLVGTVDVPARVAELFAASRGEGR